MPKEISVRIDGELCSATDGETILEVVARKRPVHTCTLLHGRSVACRFLPLVRAGGLRRRRLLPACTTPFQNGMSVVINSEKLARYRQMTLEFLFIERNHYCSVCVSNGHCELQALAQKLGVTHVRYPYNYPRLPVDVSHERYVLDHNRCILCTRCVRVCDEGEGRACLGRQLTRHPLVVGVRAEPPLGESCTSCGKCVQVCPTGALAEKGLAVEEMTKHNESIKWLATRRGVHV